MTEDFLHYVWKFRLFNKAELLTTTGEKLVVLHPGTHNFHGGPDFMNARIRIGDQLWAGHIEIHHKAGEWHQHKHTHDVHYKNVILHVVYKNDCDIFLHQPGDLPVFDISSYMRIDQWSHYEKWLKSKTWIPCEPQISAVDQLTWTSWKDRLIIERLEQKSDQVLAQLAKTGGDWNEAFYRLLARNFGFKVNSDAMELLAQSLPQTILGKHKSDPFQIEAMLFGQAGMLNEIFADEYPFELRKEYVFLQQKYALKMMNAAAWNFGRLRPSNFPTIRIAQFAALICKSEHLFSTLLETESPEDVRELFETEAHYYWNSHFRFDAVSKGEEIKKEKNARRLGQYSLENILVNTVAVILFAFGRNRNEEKYIDRALRILEICEAEKNAITENWFRLGVESRQGQDSQALIQLYNRYCSGKKCLDCMVGLKLIKS